MIGGVLLTGFGVAMMIAGIWSFVKNFKSKSYGGQADAVVVKVDTERRGTAKTGFHTAFVPTFTYRAGGREYTDSYRDGRGGDIYRPGQRVRVKYDEARPEKFMVEADNDTKGLGTIFLLTGFVIAYLGVSQILTIQFGIDLRFWLKNK